MTSQNKEGGGAWGLQKVQREVIGVSKHGMRNGERRVDEFCPQMRKKRLKIKVVYPTKINCLLHDKSQHTFLWERNADYKCDSCYIFLSRVSCKRPMMHFFNKRSRKFWIVKTYTWGLFSKCIWKINEYKFSMCQLYKDVSWISIQN